MVKAEKTNWYVSIWDIQNAYQHIRATRTCKEEKVTF